MKSKISEWLWRYGPSEASGLIMAVVSAKLAFIITQNLIVSAIIATWSDNVFYYGIMAYRDLRARKKSRNKLSLKGFFLVLASLIAECGPSEYLDSFVIRPIYLSVFPLVIPSYSLAIFAASLAANVTYYIPTIISYELQGKYLKNR